MRLGFHCHIPAIERDSKIWMPGHMGVFVDSLAASCEAIVCFQHLPLASELYQMDYAIKSDNVQLVNIGSHTSIPCRTVLAFTKRQVFCRGQETLDAMLVRAPTPLLPVLASVWRKPFILMVVGSHYADALDDLLQARWRKILIHAWAIWNSREQMRIEKRSLVFVNSPLLYNQLRPHVPHLIETTTTTLSIDDVFYRTDTCLGPPYRLLYTGRIVRAKGVFEIVEALSQLVSAGHDVILDLVGMQDERYPIIDEVNTMARSLGIGKRVLYHGYKTVGPELLAYYRRADIYVIASNSTEGFPRVIWEAMASSLPVVATQVGSIPALISGAAILVPPKQVHALTQAVIDLLTDPKLRQRLIQRGMELVRNNMLKKSTGEMAVNIEKWLASSHNA